MAGLQHGVSRKSSVRREMAAVCLAERGTDLAVHTRHCVTSDKVLEAVSRHVRFHPQHGPKKHRPETLAAQRLFVVQDNVELCTNMNSVHYDSVDRPNYCFGTEPSHKQGYMRLRCDETIVSRKRRTTYEVLDDGDELLYDEPIYDSNFGTSDSSIHTDDGSRLGHMMNDHHSHDDIQMPERELQFLEKITVGKINEGLKSPPVGRKVLAKKKLQAKSMSLPDLMDEDSKQASDSSSGYKSGGSSKSHSLLKLNTASEYSYSTIKSLTTPQELAKCTLGRIPTNSSEIPNECFQHVITKVLDSEDQTKALFESQYFLNSDMFMCNFADLFSDRLAIALGFNEGSVELATKVCAKIICDKFSSEEGHLLEEHYEVIPTLHCNDWPSQAKEWLRRVRDTRIEGNFAYTWPTQRMVERVKAMGYHLLPMGHMLKKGDRHGRLIEWQLAFPEAERYLEMCLSHAQIRCYLFTMTLYKNFLEPLDAQLGLLPSHIRTLLFWQCEKHFTLWPEDQPGDTMRKFIELIYTALQEKKLEDYFVRKHNLLDSTPDDWLHAAQEKIYRINEHLVTHMLLAIRNLRFKKSEIGGSFYPLLDYKKLYQILTRENLVTLNNPTLGRKVLVSQPPARNPMVPNIGSDPLDMWKSIKMANPNQKFAEKAHKHIEHRNSVHRQTAPKGSTESIDVKARIRKGADPLRRKMLLELFIRHFIEMAKASNRFRATKQAHFYLQQAERLTTLLSEEETEVESAREFLIIIEELRQASHKPTTSTAMQPEDRIRNFLPQRTHSNSGTESLYIRTQKPLPTDTLQHPEIDRVPVVVTLAQVHSQNINAAQVAGGRETRPAIHLPDVPEQEYDEILPDSEETAL